MLKHELIGGGAGSDGNGLVKPHKVEGLNGTIIGSVIMESSFIVNGFTVGKTLGNRLKLATGKIGFLMFTVFEIGNP